MLPHPLYAAQLAQHMAVAGAKPAAAPAKRKRRRACVVCKGAHAACDRGQPCTRCVSIGKASECQESLPSSSLKAKNFSSPTPIAASPSSSSSSSSSSSPSSASSSSSSSSSGASTSTSLSGDASKTSPSPKKRQKLAPLFSSGSTPLVGAGFNPFVPVGLATAGLHQLPFPSFLAPAVPVQAAATVGGPMPPVTTSAPSKIYADGREEEPRRETNNPLLQEALRLQRDLEEKEQKEREQKEQREHEMQRQAEREQRMNGLVIKLLKQVRLLKSTTKQLRKESEQLRTQIASMQVERRDSPIHDYPRESGSPMGPLLISSSTAASWIPYSNPSKPQSMPPVINSVFPAMSESNVPFVVDDDDKPFFIIKRQPLSDDRVAIIHTVNTVWCKILQYTSEELVGQSIRKIVEDASLRESRNRINAFHAQQAAAVSKGRNCSAYLELKPRFIRKDGSTFDALVRQQFFYDASTREPLWSILCVDSMSLDQRVEQRPTSSALISPSSYFWSLPPTVTNLPTADSATPPSSGQSSSGPSPVAAAPSMIGGTIGPANGSAPPQPHSPDRSTNAGLHPPVPPLSPATIELLNSLNSIQSWP